LGLALSARGQSPVAQVLKLAVFVHEKPVLVIRVGDLGSGAFLTPGSGYLGWVKNQDPGSGSEMNIPDHISESV
jgi:hypothetical protein